MDVFESAAVSRAQNALSMLGLSKRETRRYSLFRTINHLAFPQSDDYRKAAAFELECSREIAKRLDREAVFSAFVPAEVLQRPLGEDAVERAMSAATGSKGGFLVGASTMGLVDVLRARSVCMRMGARQLPGLVGNLVPPRQTSSVSVTWLGPEGTSVSATDQALGQLSMSPKSCVAITDVSEQLLRQTSGEAEAFFTADLAGAVAIAIDNAAINGMGGAQPLGIKNTTGVVSNQDSGTATYAKLLAFLTAVGNANALRGSPGFVTNTAAAVLLAQRQRFTGSSSGLWTGNPYDGFLCDLPAMSSEQIAAANIVFGCFDELVIGDWGVLELSTDRSGIRFNTAQVGVRALWLVDVLVRYPASFIVSTNLS